jgi:hypothetical protein
MDFLNGYADAVSEGRVSLTNHRVSSQKTCRFNTFGQIYSVFGFRARNI